MSWLDKLIGPPPEHMAAPEPTKTMDVISMLIGGVVLFLAVMVFIFIIGI